MTVRSTILFFLLFLHVLHAIHPAYFRQYEHEQQLSSLLDNLSEPLDEQQQRTNGEYSELNPNDDEDEQMVKRNKYPNFHISPLWLSRRTRTNRFYGKPLWISRTG